MNKHIWLFVENLKWNEYKWILKENWISAKDYYKENYKILKAEYRSN